MAKVIDPDLLVRATEYQYDTTVPSARTVTLSVAGNLDDTSPGSTSGVTHQALYSRMILDYAAATTAGQDLRKHGFPCSPVTESQFVWNAAWSLADPQSIDLIRDAGFTFPDGRQYAGLVQLGTSGDADQATYQQVEGGTETVSNFDKTGRINEPVQIHDGVTPLTDYLQIRLRIEGKTSSTFEVVSGLELASLQPRLYSILLANSSDPNIVETDANIDTLTPYTNMSVDYLTGQHDNVTTWAATTAYGVGDIVLVGAGAYAGRYLRATVAGTSGATDPTGAGTDGTVTWEIDPGEHQIGATYYHFSRPIAGATGTAQEIQNWGQRTLRLTSDINSDANGDGFGTVNGVNAEELFATPNAFRGAELLLAEGVWVDNFNGADQNNMVFTPHPVDGVPFGEVKFPFKVNLTFIFTPNLVGGICTLYFTNDDAGDNTGRDFDTDNAIIVNDDTPAAIDFAISSTTMTRTFDFDANVQRGAASAATAAPVTAHALQAGSAQPIVAVSTINQTDNVDIRVSALDDVVFANPA